MNQTYPVFTKGLVIGLASLVVLLVLNAGLDYHNTRQLREGGAWVAHTNEVLAALEDLVSTAKDAETGERGYLITGETSYLDPYHAALAALKDKLQRVKTLTADNPRQQARIPALEKSIAAKLGIMERTVGLRKNDPEAARQVVLSGEGMTAMEAIRAQIADMEREEQGLLRERERQSSGSYEVAVLTGLFTALLGLGLVGSFVRVLRRDLLARNKAAALLHEQREWFRTTLGSIGDAVIATDAAGRVQFLNGVAESLIGTLHDEAVGKPLGQVFHIINEETRQVCEDPVAKVLKSGIVVGLANHTALISEDGTEKCIADSAAPIHDAAGNVTGVVLVFRDVTEQKRVHEERETTVEFLRLVNGSTGTRDLIQTAAIFFQQRCGCQAVGIRLKEGDDYPYYEARGFPQEFLLVENSLCARDDAGKLMRDAAGNPVIECMCGNVICGRFDAAKPFFTPHGSFWTNSTTELLASSSEADRQSRTRNRCNGEGYESVALLPLHVGQQRLGLLQLNDRRKGVFSPESIGLWERLADHLAVALAKFQADAAVSRLASFPEVNPNPIAEVDLAGRIRYINPFARHLFPDLAERGLAHPWLNGFEVISSAFQTGQRGAVEREMTVGDRHYQQTAYYVEEGPVVRLYGMEITARKRAEEALRKTNEELEQRVAERTAEVRATAESLQQLAAIVESSDDAIIGKTLDGVIVSWNCGAEKVYGYTAAEMLGKSIALLAPPDHPDEVPQILEGIRRGEPVVHYEADRIRKDGRHISVALSVSPIHDAAGRVVGASTVAHDITARNEIQRRDSFTQALLEPFARNASRKEYLDAVVEVVRAWSGCRCAGIRVADQQGRIPYESYVGYSREFWEHENCLSLKTDACICTRMFLQARDVQEAECVTPGGSFRCDDAAAFVGGLTPDQQARYRGHCVKVGFKSLAAVPIRYRDQVLGVIHLADERPDVMPAASVEFLESMAPLIGEGIHRFNVEDELRSASLYARSLLEASLDPLVTISPEGKITDVNEATEAVTGVPRARLIGSDFSDYFTEPHRASEGYQRVIAQGFVTDYPLTIRHMSGRTTDVLYNAVVYKNEAGQMQGVFAAARDVTERKRMEEALRVASLYARSLLEASLDPLVTISPEGKITDVNEATEAVTGVPRARLIGSDFSDYFTEPQRASEGYRQVIAQGSVTDYPLTIRHVSGRTADVLYNAVVYKNEAGQMQGVFAAARDVTERKRAEEELARHREHLEELVQQRTAELQTANKQLEMEIVERNHAAEVLRRTAEELARSNKELEQFAYVASHDLQEPVRVITGYLQLIERRYKGKIDADVDQFIYYVIDGATRMQQLISDLLEYSRVGTRGEPFRPTDMRRVLEKTLAGLEKLIEESGAVVTHDPLPTVQGDETRLIQLLQNLIANGIKFRSQRRPEIHIAAEQKDGRWQFAVRDNGIGIEPQYWSQIFVIFRRLHTRQKYAGTGIGLAICKKIVERHGGKIWLDSQPGEGTTFYFTL